MGLYKKFVNQTRKPEGTLGKMMVNGMNSGHAKMADWGMSHLPEMNPSIVLDVGCGGGRNARELAKKYPFSKVTAIDYSEVSVAKATEYNKDLIEFGRIIVKRGDVSELRLPEASYDLATAFETIYFWPGLEKCFAEVFRIMKADGTFLIVNESDGTDKTALQFERIIDGMKCYTVDIIEAALNSAGFCEIKSYHHPSKPWIAVLAKKAEA